MGRQGGLQLPVACSRLPLLVFRPRVWSACLGEASIGAAWDWVKVLEVGAPFEYSTLEGHLLGALLAADLWVPSWSTCLLV